MHLQNFLFGFSTVLDTQTFMNSLHQHLGEFLPFDTPTKDALLKPISQTLNSNSAKTNSSSGQEFVLYNKEEEKGTDEQRRRERK